MTTTVTTGGGSAHSKKDQRALITAIDNVDESHRLAMAMLRLLWQTHLNTDTLGPPESDDVCAILQLTLEHLTRATAGADTLRTTALAAAGLAGGGYQ